MSVYGMRHGAVVPRGFTFPASLAQDSWEDRTQVVPVHILADVIREKTRKPYRPAWQSPDADLPRPDADTVRRWCRAACAYRTPERKAYAVAWVKFCCLGGLDAPEARGLAPSDARRIQRRFAELELFDPRDFEGVPF